ncbi:Lnk3-like isoform x1 [Thalictrum thalictroides]|uniref:Lnk3-like isoform x1 n=1 Tax=Thalictrum thalictroides TaxID=46969 RepID=A0A7J6WRI3_THATH|nr:Lnk3-like isoform x1 [Thalictrum thalictroides]
MEWYMVRDDDEMIVPQDQEKSEQSLLQDNSCQWKEGLSMYGELPTADYGIWDSDNKLVGDWLDYQLDGMSAIDQMNDNFMNSIFEENTPRMRSTYQCVGNFPESECSTMSSGDLLTDVGMDSQSISTDQLRRGNVSKLEVPSSMDWNTLDDPPTYTSYDSENVKKSVARHAHGNKANSSLVTDGQVDEETSFEEVAIRELELAMTQLTEETRICFRDSLYRLAKSSRQRQLEIQSQSEEQTIEGTFLTNVHGETSRFGKVEHMESETNYFDSTVAHLMFNELSSTPDVYRVSVQKSPHSNHVM